MENPERTLPYEAAWIGTWISEGLRAGEIGLHLLALPPLWATALDAAFLAIGSKQYSAAIAFTLALFSHLVNHVNIRLQAELEEGENPVPAFQSDGTGTAW